MSFASLSSPPLTGFDLNDSLAKDSKILTGVSAYKIRNLGHPTKVDSVVMYAAYWRLPTLLPLLPSLSTITMDFARSTIKSEVGLSGRVDGDRGRMVGGTNDNLLTTKVQCSCALVDFGKNTRADNNGFGLKQTIEKMFH
jgi:hypothetical protein